MTHWTAHPLCLLTQRNLAALRVAIEPVHEQNAAPLAESGIAALSIVVSAVAHVGDPRFHYGVSVAGPVQPQQDELAALLREVADQLDHGESLVVEREAVVR